jgi:hypothetical protein
VLCRVKHPTKLVILDSETRDILHKAFHNDSIFLSYSLGERSIPFNRDLPDDSQTGVNDRNFLDCGSQTQDADGY